MSRDIDYGNLMHQAMRGLIRRVLQRVADDGLPGDHHFFITLDTAHPELEIADWLADRYDDEMTIVIQHWFADLDVGEDGFAITLNFGNQPERLNVPYDAIRTFVDPSVEFGLRFETQESKGGPSGGEAGGPRADDAPMAENVEPEAGDAEVVRLDSFRK